jgi:hypothetical protein
VKPAHLLAFAVLAGVFLWAIAPLQQGMATHAEEAVGLTQMAPLRPGAGEVEPARDDHPQLRASAHLPVWGVVWRDGTYTPLLVDGHQGALVFAPSRWAHALGGLTAARAVSALYGASVLVALILMGYALSAPLAGWLAATVAAASPHLAFFHHWARPDEQATWVLPLWAVLAFAKWGQSRRPVWGLLGALLVGLAVSAKLTAGWALLGMAAAVLVFRWLPWPGWRALGLAALVAGLPLLPQVAFLLAGPDTGAFAQRIDNLPSPMDLLVPARWAFFAQHFIEAFGGLGGYVQGIATGVQPELGVRAWTVGGAVALGVVAAVVAGGQRQVAVAQRAFGVGLGTTLLLYVGLYYTGMSLYGLLVPWVPLAVGLAGARAWAFASGLVDRRQGRVVASLLVVVAVAVVANGVWEIHRMHGAFDRPTAELFARAAQQRVADRLQQDPAMPTWTVTYNAVAVYETLTQGRVRPQHAHRAFVDAVGMRPDDPAAYDAAWDRVLGLVRQQACSTGKTLQRLVVSPGALHVDVSPLRHPDWLAQRLPTALARADLATQSRHDERAFGGQAPLLSLWTVAVTCRASTSAIPSATRP